MIEPPFLSALLVEDEPQLAITLKIAFRKLGIAPLYASTLSEAEKLITHHGPEFILLDRTLPMEMELTFVISSAKPDIPGLSSCSPQPEELKTESKA